MNHKDRVKLRFGPYRTPRFKYGDVVFCERCGEVTLCGLSSGRIPLPMCRRGKAKAIALVGHLVKAIRHESAIAVQHWWGVGQDTVWKWRKVLGVGRTNKGTHALKSEYSKEPRFQTFRKKGWAKARDPQRRAKISAALKGKTPPQHVMEAAWNGNRGRNVTKETRRKMSETHKKLGTRPPHGRQWTQEEDALVRACSPAEVAKRTGRTLRSIWVRRHVLKMPDGRHNNGKVPHGGPWTAEEDSLLRSLLPGLVAKRTGRGLKMIYRRRRTLRRMKVKLPDGRQNNGRAPKARTAE